jgi:hypothetical protein
MATRESAMDVIALVLKNIVAEVFANVELK